MAEVVYLSDYCVRKSQEFWTKARNSRIARNHERVKECEDIARDLESLAEVTHPNWPVIVRLPEYSGSSFSIDNGGAA